jgi:phage/plasmid-like protein (TIGR03299 family)
MSDAQGQTISGRSMIFAGGVGVATPNAKTAAEAMAAGGLDWKVELRDAGYSDGNGFRRSTIGRKAVVRVNEDGDAVTDFGYVGRKYTLIQNAEMFDFCDRLVDDYGAKYEAAWSLYGGQEVGLTMVFPDTVMVGGVDPHGKYLLLRARHDGTGSVKLVTTKVRLYCTNMLNTAARGATNRLSIAHLSNATQKIAAARDALEVTFKHDEAFSAEMEAMVTQYQSDEAFKAIAQRLLADARFGGVEAKADAMVSLRASSPTLQDEFRTTAYGSLQAVTEWTDWSRETKSAQGRVIDLLDGRVKRIKEQAVELLRV